MVFISAGAESGRPGMEWSTGSAKLYDLAQVT